MELNCPNCGAGTEVPGVLIPGARLTTTCWKCGAKFGGVVPARAENRSRGEDSGSSGQERRGAVQRKRERGRGHYRPEGRGTANGPQRDGVGGGRNRLAGSGDPGGRRSGAGSYHVGDGRDTRSGENVLSGHYHGPSADGRRGPSGRKDEDMTGRPREGRTPLRVVAKGLDPERLAKLVASDMLLYNREKIERAVGQGCLLSDMAAEIVEAWEFYKGRVGEETAKGTPYFRDAVNNIFGEGNPVL